MQVSSTATRIHDAGIIAVVRAENSDEAVRVVGALMKAGAPAIELTFTTPNVDVALREVRRVYGPTPLIGAGTLRHVDQVAVAVASGADFLVSPNLSPEVLTTGLATGMPTIPGVFTPSEVAAALDLGASVVKLFPASTGGIGHFKALLGPFPDIKVVPTGGVDLNMIGDWLAAGAFAVGVGSEICPRALMREGRWSEITGRARQFIEAAHAARPELTGAMA
jgi:2-dehydro-3-deoxyphosphogluconate aldolase/(4S)-4-hydroxy-2-oxoglutarate aldolase